MRESLSKRFARSRDGLAPGPQAGNLVQKNTRHYLLLATVLAFGTMWWQHGVLFAGPTSPRPQLLLLGLDTLLAVPFAGMALVGVGAVGHRLGLGRSSGRVAPLAQAGAIAIAFTVLFVPFAVLQAFSHLTLAGTAGGTAGGTAAGTAGAGSAAAALPGGDPVGVLGYGLTQALYVQPAVLVLAVLAVAALRVPGWRWWRRRARAARRPAIAVPAAAALVAGFAVAPFLAPSPASADHTSPRGCGAAPQRTYDVRAINVDVVVNQTGDHDPFGFMYVLEGKLAEARAQEAALQAASALPIDDPDAAKVSGGLRQDPIQPLVLRARLGECVVIRLRNDLTDPPRGGRNGNPTIVQPGGVPNVSIDMQGVSYDAQSGDGGQQVGGTTGSTMTRPGQTRDYRFFLDPLMGEGTKVFRSGGESTQLTAHGLFGALVVEPAGARWFDPETGEDKTDDPDWSNWEAMVQAPGEPAFREFAILYHEIGDENFNLRRPLRENADVDSLPGDQGEFGRPIPMIDTAGPDPENPRAGGGATRAYRPGSRAINYRSESFWRRLQHEAPRGQFAQKANESLAYSSYTYGDPATPIARSYLGEPTKTRLAHAGFEQLHVHHLHGGATRWRQNPNADDTDMSGGLKKVPLQDAQSIRLDSQTISPEESFSLEHECGAGGCQQAAGDFLFHCHIAHHYIAGMWGIWRVFDTDQSGLAPLPDRAPPAEAVSSAALLGSTLSNGRTVVLDAELTDPDTQVALESLVEDHLPPQGARWDSGDGPDPDDATVWDWLKSGPPDQPVYVGEPETTSVWANYRSATPGQRHPITFNPANGRPAHPLLSPHLGQRPPFSPNEHSGAPYLGETGSAERPDGLCPQTADVREYDITAVNAEIPLTQRETNAAGMLFVLNEDKDDLISGARPPDPLVIRSNVGDCVDISFGQQLDPGQLPKTNMHTHFVQFDPQASDGIITGFAYEQSVFSTDRESRVLVSVDSPDTVTVNHVDQLRTGIAIGVGVGTPEIEIRTIADINGDTLTFDRPLENPHPPGVPVTVEFVQYRWYSDVDAGTVFWHDHVDGIISWALGLFGAHVIEPAGSTYRDPRTGQEARSGTIVDIVNQDGSVGVDQAGSFREYVIFLHNGRRGRNELTAAGGGLGLNFGQECEEGSINLRAAPLGERTPPGATPADPTTTDQRQEYNGQRCRNAFSRTGDDPGDAAANTARATISTVDPYVFSSVKYGDPPTPLLRAYAGDDVVIRTIGLTERAEALRLQGHRFRMERFNEDGRLMDTAVTGISERFDYVLDGGAGGPDAIPGDYLYYSTRTFALESGAWGIFRVHDTLQSDLLPLPGGPAPPGGPGFPLLIPATGNTQQNPGPDPPPAFQPDGAVDTGVVTSTADPCPGGAPSIHYDVSIFEHTLPTAPFADTGGVIYALTSDVAAIRSGQQRVEPLVLRANHGDCVNITLHNEVDPDSRYGGTRAGFDLGMLSRNPQLAAGSAIGLNPDTTVAVGGSVDYRFFADEELGTSIFQNLGSPASLRHGGYGLLIVEPQGSTWSDSADDSPLGPQATSSQAVIRAPGGESFREFALTLQTTDQHYSRSIVPYIDMVAGNGINSDAGGARPNAPVEGAPPGTADNEGSFDKAFSHVSYHSEPLTERIGLTANPDAWWLNPVAEPFDTALSSLVHDDPDTPIFRALPGDPVIFRVGVGASDQLHSFTVSGHMYPLEPDMWDDATDHRSQLMTSRTITAGQTLDAKLVGGAGGPQHYSGDYAYRDGRQPFADAGIWGILRVQVSGSGGITPL